MIKIVKDPKYNYTTMFNTENGHYVRISDALYANSPHIIDIGVAGRCRSTGLCMKAGVKCYQNGLASTKKDMSLEDFKRIIDEIKNKTFEVALGGAGDPTDIGEDFVEMVKYARANGVVPSLTSSCFGMTPEKAEICKKYCGAVAVSQYSRIEDRPVVAYQKNTTAYTPLYKSFDDIPIKFTLNNMNKDCYQENQSYIINNEEFDWMDERDFTDDFLNGEYILYRVYNEKQKPNYTLNGIKMLLDAGVLTNIHYVLSNTTIDEAILRLKHHGFPTGINAVIFLLHKPVGLGDESDVIKYDDPRLVEFFELIDQKHDYKIGFDSCTIPALINFSKNINMNSVDTCEAARFSMYITADMIALPCSFDNVDQKYAFDLKNGTIQEAWDSEQFNKFRNIFEASCPGCTKRTKCLGGCPLQPSITLCNKKEKYNK
jgi:radical SAM protein with 4Fe4S-binding SPASM domain